MTARGGTGTIDRQIMWTRLVAIVEEQAQALIRTAFSTSVREAGDLSAGVYDEAGRMLAQAVTGTPGHVNAMCDAVPHFMTAMMPDGREPEEGDVWLTNDPWLGTGHLHDITVVTPAFHAGRHVGFLACTAHVTDIGGRGFGADGNSVYEEGLYLPIVPLLRAGEVDRTLLAILRANSRTPDELVGDVMALATSNSVGVRRVGEMLREFEEPDLGGVSEFIRQASLSATRARIAELSPGRAEAAMRTDGFSAPVELRCAVTVGDGEIECDFAGTSGLDPKGINVPLVYTKAYAAYAMKCAIAPDIPNNAASLSPFSIAAPEGSIVNAPHPAPVALRHVIGHLIPDVVFGALDQLVPGVVPAEGAGALCNFQLSLRPTGQGGRSAEVLSFNSGGAGARPSLDGLSATAFPSGVMTMPAEAVEHSGPVVVWRKELRGGSGGHGTFRGGLGQVMEVGARPGHEMTISAMLDRVENPARGRRGGGTGAATDISLHDGTPLRGKGRQRVPADARVVMKFPGGGGYGPAGERSRAAVLRDVAMGYVDPEDAVREYGADPAEVDAAVTAAARGQLP